MNSLSLRFMRGQLLREVITLLLFAGLTLQTMQAAAPSWWSDRSVRRPGATADDYAVANVGQLKNFASKAAQEMNASLVGGAGPEITALIAAWSNAPGGSMIRDDYAALTAGQLKAVAKKFYDRLAIVGNGTPGMYPWNGRNADDYALVNVGQLKAVFAFGIAMGTNALLAMADIDSDNDGFSDLDEYLSGTDLQNASSMPNGGYVSLSDDSTNDGPDPEPVFSFYSRKKTEWGYLQGYPALTDIPGGIPRLFRTRTIIDTYTGTETQNGSSSSGSSSLSYSESLEYTSTDQYNSSVITGSIMASADESVLGVKRLTQDVNGHGTYSSSSNTSGAPLAYQFYNAEQTASGSFLDDSVKTELHGTEDISDYDNAEHTINNTYDGDNFQKKVSLAYSDSPPVSTEVEKTASYQSTTHTYQFRNNGSNGSSSWNNSADVTTRSQIILSGAISLSELGQMVKSSLSAKDWPNEFVKSVGPSPPFATCDIYNYGLNMYATDVEYYVALQWPDGTPESVKQKPQQPRDFSWVERYSSVDGVRESTQLRTVSLLPGQQSSHYTASAISIDHTRSGDVGESMSSFALKAYEVMADGSISQATGGIEASLPSPVIEMECQLDNVRFDADGRLIGDLSVSGGITSAMCNTIKGDKGKITQAQLWVNDEETPQATINLTVTKEEGGPRNSPYPYSGSFDRKFSGVPLTAGNNVFKVTAEDQVYHIQGYNTWVADIQEDIPEDDEEVDTGVFAGATGVSQQFTLTAQLANAYLDWNEADEITATVNLNGTVYTDVTLTETDLESGIFTGTLTDGRPVSLTLDSVDAPQVESRDILHAKLLLGQGGSMAAYNVSLAESAADPSQFTGSQVITTFVAADAPQGNGQTNDAGNNADAPPLGAPPPSQSTLQITANTILPLEKSNGGTLHRYMYALDENLGPDCTLQVGGQSLRFIRDNESGLTVLQHPDHADTPLVTHLRNPAEAPSDKGFDQAKLDEVKHYSYLRGVSAGFYQGSVQMISDTGDAVVGVWEYAVRDVAWVMLGAKLVYQKATGEGDQDLTMDAMIEIYQPNADIHQQAADLGQFLHDFIEPLNPFGMTQKEVKEKLLIGDTAGALQTALNASQVHRMVFNFVAESLTAVRADYADGSPGQKGYIEGRILFEAAVFIFPFTKAGKLVEASKAKFLEKLLATQIPRKGMRDALRPLAYLMKKTKMCFVAGTLVRTLNGLMPIEQVKEGMFVRSRDEGTGQIGWKRVVQTFTTHPSEVHQLTYELRGPPEERSEASRAEAADRNGTRPPAVRSEASVSIEILGVTAPHPFYVCNRVRPGFVAAGEIKPGDELFVSGHRRAVVVANIVEYAPAGETFTTYNFEVEDFHTYFVGQGGVWVHNDSPEACARVLNIFQNKLKDLNNDITQTWLRTSQKIAKVTNANLLQLKLFNEVRPMWLANLANSAPPWLNTAIQHLPAGVKGSAGRLRANMEKALGVTKPKGMASHHIVEKLDNPDVRDVIERAGLHIDEAANGVWMPRKAMIDEYAANNKANWLDGLGPNHDGSHTSRYSDAIAARIIPLDGQGGDVIRNELQQIAKELIEGTFPWP